MAEICAGCIIALSLTPPLLEICEHLKRIADALEKKEENDEQDED